MSFVVALVVTFLLLAISEVLWRTKRLRGETARKFVHITVGTFVAFWPYFMSWRQIQLMSAIFFVVVFLSIQGHIFHALRYVKRKSKTRLLDRAFDHVADFFSFRSVHKVKRRTWGELFFPIGIGMSALIMPPNIIFTAAILHLSLADGFAAVIGLRYGMLHKYSIRSYTKTIAGTATFWLISTAIIAATVGLSTNGLSWPLLPLLVWLPLAATVLENFAVAGTDNVVVPLLVIIVLQTAHIV